MPVKQHGFQVKEHLWPGPDELAPNFRRVASAKCEVGFKGLLDVAVRGSMPRADSERWGYPMTGHVEVVGTAHSTPAVRRMVKSVVQGMRACQDPEASAEGLGGTYFFMNEQGTARSVHAACRTTGLYFTCPAYAADQRSLGIAWRGYTVPECQQRSAVQMGQILCSVSHVLLVDDACTGMYMKLASTCHAVAAGEKVAIMKPCDEEPLAPNNPKVRPLVTICRTARPIY